MIEATVKSADLLQDHLMGHILRKVRHMVSCNGTYFNLGILLPNKHATADVSTFVSLPAAGELPK